MRMFSSVLVIALVTGTATAQTRQKPVPPPPAPVTAPIPSPAEPPITLSPEPPMPANIATLGDVDAVCFMANVQTSTIAQSMPASPPGEKAKLESFAVEQVAFTMGRVTARFADGAAQDQSSKSAKAWVTVDASFDKRPIMRWCMRNTSSQINAFPTNMNAAYKTAENLVARGRGDIKPENLDPDALCLILAGVALPATQDRAAQDPSAKAEVKLLRETQSYFMGRTLAKTRKAPIDQSLAEALLYSGTLSNAKDEPTANTKVSACIGQYTSAKLSLFQSALKGVESGLAPVKPK